MKFSLFKQCHCPHPFDSDSDISSSKLLFSASTKNIQTFSWKIFSVCAFQNVWKYSPQYIYLHLCPAREHQKIYTESDAACHRLSGAEGPASRNCFFLVFGMCWHVYCQNGSGRQVSEEIQSLKFSTRSNQWWNQLKKKEPRAELSVDGQRWEEEGRMGQALKERTSR